MEGWVEEILIAATAGEPATAVRRARAVRGVGLEGDRYSIGAGTWSDYPVEGGKALTLIEAEVLTAVGLPWEAARRNVVTRGIRLNALVGRRFRIGEVECHGDRLCEPCVHLERLTGVTVAALAHRGGLRADILTHGAFSVGDSVTAEAIDLL